MEEPSTAITVTAPSRYPALDGLRGFAVLLVFFFHYGGGLKSHILPIRLFGAFTEVGWIGVILFFSLSGFLITGNLFDSIGEPHRLRNFYIHRALRILPLYVFILLLDVLLHLRHGFTHQQLQSVAIYFAFLQDIPRFTGLALIFPPPLPVFHLWTLAVEEQFYLFWPLLMLMARTRRAAMSLALWIFTLSAIFRFAIWGLPVFNTARFAGYYDHFLFTHAGALALGSALALAIRSSRPGRKSTSSRTVGYWGNGAFYLGIIIFFYVSYISGNFYIRYPLQYFIGLPAISLAATAAIPPMLRHGPARTLFTITPLRRMGRISYGFYIYHLLLQPLYDRIAQLLTRANGGNLYQLIRLIAAFFITLIVASLSYNLMERPFLSLKRRFPLAINKPLPVSTRN